MAIADVAQAETFYAEDRATGYSTQTILATKLAWAGIVGVREFVKRDGRPPYMPCTRTSGSGGSFATPSRPSHAHETAG